MRSLAAASGAGWLAGLAQRVLRRLQLFSFSPLLTGNSDNVPCGGDGMWCVWMWWLDRQRNDYPKSKESLSHYLISVPWWHDIF